MFATESLAAGVGDVLLSPFLLDLSKQGKETVWVLPALEPEKKEAHHGSSQGCPQIFWLFWHSN